MEVGICAMLAGSKGAKSGKLTAGYQCDDGESRPFSTTIRKSQERREQRQYPEFPKNTVEGAFIKEFTAIRQREHSDDLNYSRWNGEHVGIESREP